MSLPDPPSSSKIATQWRRLEELATKLGTGGIAAVRIASKWMVGDVTFAVLPLLVLAMVYALTGQPFAEFFHLKEWSFANIVFFGVAQNRMTSLRDGLPRDSRSWRIATGTQLFGLGLIASVLVLAVVILHEQHLLSDKMSLQHLGTAQQTLFITGVLSILVCVLAEERTPPPEV